VEEVAQRDEGLGGGGDEEEHRGEVGDV
jgi:hypothetical protein